MNVSDIITNILSDAIFVGAIALIVWLLNRLLYWRRLDQAIRFFNLDRDDPIRIYVSGFEHPGVRTKRVVNAYELEAAILLKNSVANLYGKGFLSGTIGFLARLIGKTASYPEPTVKPAPLEPVGGPLTHKTVILVGGPVANMLTRYYLGAFEMSYRFNRKTEKYQRKDDAVYRDLASSHTIAVIEKIVNDDQVVILLHGYGEENTNRAVKHLAERWMSLFRKHGTDPFAEIV